MRRIVECRIVIIVRAAAWKVRVTSMYMARYHTVWMFVNVVMCVFWGGCGMGMSVCVRDL